jgi:hypothetical protein
MTNLQQHVSIPSSRGRLIEWLNKAASATEATERIIKIGEVFAGRSHKDCRAWSDGSTRVDGVFLDVPGRQTLWQGSEDERARGLFYDDGTEFTKIRPFSETIQLMLTPPIPDGHFRFKDGSYTDTSPLELPYQRLMDGLSLGPLDRVFAVKNHLGECGAYFFPMLRWGQENLYFVVEINARYGDISCTFFQGDPEVRCALRTRGPRTHEVEEYFSSRASWGAKECPHIIPITYSVTGSTPAWTNPQPIELRDVLKANNTLKVLIDETGQGTYLDSNSG